MYLLVSWGLANLVHTVNCSLGKGIFHMILMAMKEALEGSPDCISMFEACLVKASHKANLSQGWGSIFPLLTLKSLNEERVSKT